MFIVTVRNDRLSQPRKSQDVDAAVFDCVVDDALFQAFPFFNNTMVYTMIILNY